MTDGKKVGSIFAELGVVTDGFDRSIKDAFKRGEEAVNKLDRAVTAADNIGKMLETLGKMGSEGSHLASTFAKISAVIGKITLPLSLLLIGIRSLIVEFKVATGTASAWEKLRSKITHLTIQFDKLLIPGAHLATLLAKLTVKFVKLGKKIADVALHPIDSLKKGFEKLKNSASKAVEKIKGLFEKLKNSASKAVEKIKGLFGKLVNFLKSAGGKISSALAGAFALGAVGAKKLVTGVIDMSSQMELATVTLKNLIQGNVTAFLAKLSDKAKETTMTFKEYIKAAVGMVGVFGEGKEFEDAIDLTADLTAALKFLDVTSEEVTRTLRKLKTGQIGEAFERLGEWGFVWTKIFPEAGSIEDVSKLGVEEIYKRMTKAIKDSLGDVAEESATTLAGIRTNIRDWIDRVLFMIGDAGFFDKVREGAQKTLETIERLAANGTLQRWANTISANLSGVYDVVMGLKNGLMDMFGVASGGMAQGGTDVLSREIEEAKNRVEKIDEIMSHSLDTRSWFDLDSEKRELEAFISRLEDVYQPGEIKTETPPIFDKITDAIPGVLEKIKAFVLELKAEFDKIWTIISGGNDQVGQPGSTVGGRITSSLNVAMRDAAASIDVEPFIEVGRRVLEKIVEGMQDKLDEYMKNKKGLMGITYRIADAIMEGDVGLDGQGIVRQL